MSGYDCQNICAHSFQCRYSIAQAVLIWCMEPNRIIRPLPSHWCNCLIWCERYTISLCICLSVTYKSPTIALLSNTYKSLPVAQPTYLHLLLQQYQPTRSLRSGRQNLLALPTLSSEFGRHAPSYCAPSVWNKLPLSIRSLNSFNSFRSHLKTHPFAQPKYPPSSCHLATVRSSDSSLELDCCARYQVFVCMYVCLSVSV